MNRPALIVCEANGQWAMALRRALAGGPVKLVETRRPVDAWEELIAAPASLLALAWSSERRAELAELVDRVGRRFPLALVAVLLDRRERGEGQLAAELGAVYVCRSPRRVAEVARLAWRHLGPQPQTHWPAMDQAIEHIWQSLPWSSDVGQERVH